MRNKIIALTLTVVMVIAALVSCASPYNYAEEDLTKYATIDAAAFKAALKDIKIEDADFTTDDAIRDKKVLENIFSTLTTYAEGQEDKKKTDGKLGINDVLYYAYYTTYVIEGVEYKFDMGNMKVTDFASATTADKNSHSIKLPLIDVEDEDEDKLSVALKTAIKAAIEANKEINAYKTVTTTNTAIKKQDETDKTKYNASFGSIYVSYIREYKTTDGATAAEEAKYEEINLKDPKTDVEKEIVKILLDAKTTAKIGSVIEIEKENNVKVKTFDVKDGETTYTYKNFKILFAVEKAGEEFVKFDYTPYTDKKEIEPDSLYKDGVKVTIPKDAKLTYHVYPVYYYQVSDIDATSIIIEVLGSKISTSSLDILASEEYKTGDKTIKSLVEELVKIQGDTSENENLKNLKKAYDDAAKAVKDAGSKATTEQKEKEETTKKAYDDAKKKAIADQTAEILKATSTKADAKPIAEVIVSEYKADIKQDLKNSYDNAIVENLGKAIWKIVTDSVKVTSYPEALIKETVDHLRNEYEYKFYTGTVGDKENAESNYTNYGGDFDAYLKAELKADDNTIEKKLTEKAQEYVKPVIQLYVAAKALEKDAEAAMPEQVTANSFIYEDDANGKKFADYCAKNFIVDDEALKQYKEIFGDIVYESYIDTYGESNFRTSLQSNNFFDYLLSAKLDKDNDGDYLYKDGKLDFYNIGYSIKVEDADADKADK